MLFAHLRGLHARLGFGLGLIGAVVHNGRGRCGGLGVNYRALLGRGIANDIILGGYGGLSSKDKSCKRYRNDIFLHIYLLGFLVTLMKHSLF